MTASWIEEYLTKAERDALARLSDALGGPPEWWRVEPLRRIGEAAGWRRAVNTISEQAPLRTKEQVAAEAAEAVGVELETVRSRVRRWLERAYSATL